MALDPLTEIADERLAVWVRMLARAVSTIYDRALSEYGLMIAQVNILVFVERSRSSAPGAIGRALHLERSTVSRNLERMIAQGWLAAATDAGGRVREVRLTAKGQEKLVSCLGAWRSAQEQAASLRGMGASKRCTLWAAVSGSGAASVRAADCSRRGQAASGLRSLFPSVSRGSKPPPW